MLNPKMLVLFAMLLMALPVASLCADSPTELGPWKTVGKLKLPAPAVDMTVSEDKKFVLALCVEKRRRDSGGATPGFVEIYALRCFAVGTGKETMAGGNGQLAPRMALRSTRLALSDMFDKVTVYDLTTGTKLCQIDPRSPNDSPPGSDKGIPKELGVFGVGGRISDLEFTADAKILLTIRRENTAWKTINKGAAFTSESFDRVIFWDADKGTKLATLDCEDKQMYDGHLTLLPTRNQMLARFSNGVRILDLSSKKWSKSYSMKDVWNSSISADEKMIAVTGRDQSVRLLDSDSLKLLMSIKEQPINTMPRLDGSLNPTGFEFGPSAFFVDGDRALRVVLNDQKTVVYHDAKTGAKIKTPASEAMPAPGGAGARVVAMSPDRRFAVTVLGQSTDNCTLWQRDVLEKK